MGKRQREPVEIDDSFIDIDSTSLDREWVKQPRLYFKYSQMLADANRDFDSAKAELDVVRAELDTSIRSDPERYGLEKVTENSIASCIPIQDEYQEAMRRLVKARHARDVVQAAVNALDHKKKALEKLVDLHLSSYYATPRASSNSREAVEDIERRSVRRSLPSKRK